MRPSTGAGINNNIRRQTMNLTKMQTKKKKITSI